jgi:hypothetical protein
MVRNKTQKRNDTEPKKPRGRKRQTQQIVEPESHSPAQTSDPQAIMLNSMMPMIMMVMMFAILMPMMKRLGQNDGESTDHKVDHQDVK